MYLLTKTKIIIFILAAIFPILLSYANLNNNRIEFQNKKKDLTQFNEHTNKEAGNKKNNNYSGFSLYNITNEQEDSPRSLDIDNKPAIDNRRIIYNDNDIFMEPEDFLDDQIVQDLIYYYGEDDNLQFLDDNIEY